MISKIKELGLSLISVLLFQIALSLVSIRTSFNFLELKNFTNSSELSSSQLILEIIISALLIVSILIFIFKKKLGIILYTLSIILSILLSIIFVKLDIENLLISLIFPLLTLTLVYFKRKILFK